MKKYIFFAWLGLATCLIVSLSLGTAFVLLTQYVNR